MTPSFAASPARAGPLAWLRRDRRRLAFALLLLAALAVRAALPAVVELAIESQGTQRLGRVVEVGDVGLAVLAGAVAIESLAVGPLFEAGERAPVDPEEALFLAQRLEAHWSWLALLRGELRLEAFEVEAPQLVFVRAADGALVPLLGPQPEAAESEPPPDGAEPGWPLRLDRLRLRELSLLYVDLAAPGQRPLDFELAELSLDDLVLRDRDIAFGALALRAPRLRMRRDLDIAALAGGEPAAAGAPAEPHADPRTGTFRMAELTLDDASVQLVLEDREIAAQLSLRAREISSEPGARFPLELELALEGGRLAVEGEVGGSPPAFDGAVTWSDLPLAPLFAAAATPLTASGGSSSGALQVQALLAEAAGGGPARIDVSGQIGIEGLDAAARDDSLAIGWGRLDLELARLAIQPGTGSEAPAALEVELAALRLEEPALRWTQRAAAPTSGARAAPAPETDATTDEPSPRLRVDRLEVSGGTAELVDETLKPIHRSRIRDLDVRGRDLRWPQRDARELRVTARGPGETRLTLEAALQAGQGRAALDLEDLGLAHFSAQAARAAGYRLEDGSANLRAELQAKGGRYALDSDLVLQGLRVREVRPGIFEQQFSVPLDLALALLEDPSGKITLPIAAEFGAAASGVALAPILTAALRQALVGTLSAPLKGLGLLVRAGGADGGLRLAPLPAEPGSRTAELAGLPDLARVLEARPGLGTRLRGRVGPADDPALAERILIAKLLADEALPPLEAGFLQERRLRRALEDRARGQRQDIDPEDAQALARWIQAVEVSDGARDALANDRGSAVRDALAKRHGIAAERIQLGEPLRGEPGVVVELAPVEH